MSIGWRNLDERNIQGNDTAPYHDGHFTQETRNETRPTFFMRLSNVRPYEHGVHMEDAFELWISIWSNSFRMKLIDIDIGKVISAFCQSFYKCLWSRASRVYEKVMSRFDQRERFQRGGDLHELFFDRKDGQTSWTTK
jgi:hypothetical protein